MSKKKPNAAVLVNLTIHAFVNELSDKAIAAEVALNHGAASGTGKYLKERLPPLVLRPIDRVISKARQYHYKATAPWLDRGVRMMAAALIMDYTKDMTQFKGELQQEVKALCGQLTMLDSEAKRLRGTLYSPDLIPSEDALRYAWDLDIELLPVPLVDDFRIDFLENKFIKKFKENSKKRLDSQGQHVRQLMLDPLLRLEQTFQTDSPRVRSSTMSQLSWVCEHAGDLALDQMLGDQLQACAKQIEQYVIRPYDPDGRPKYDMEAIEGALATISEVKIELGVGEVA